MRSFRFRANSRAFLFVSAGPSVERKPASHDSPPSIQPVGLCEVHVTNKRVQTNTCSAFSADPADSNAQALRSNTSAVAEAARLWPKASNGRPHRQLRTERRRGKRCLRRTSTRKGAELILERRLDGKETNGLPKDRTVTSFFQMCPWRAIETSPVQELSALRDCPNRPYIKTFLQRTDDEFSNWGGGGGGWRSFTIFMASAQLAQCVAGCVRLALRSPRPPSHNGRVA